MVNVNLKKAFSEELQYAMEGLNEILSELDLVKQRIARMELLSELAGVRK